MHMCVVCDDCFATLACSVLLCLCAHATVHVMHAMRLHAQFDCRMLKVGSAHVQLHLHWMFVFT